jgi:DNA-binding HxlR family transcriptional regulator
MPAMGSYRQYCPVAMASELLGERWTVLVVRELLCGSRRFNDLRRGLPRMSPSLLVKRLRALERAGVVSRGRRTNGAEYELTDAGLELRPIVEAMGHWGERWVRSDLPKLHLDASLLMWDIRRSLHRDRLPAGRLVVRFSFADGPPQDRRFWLIVNDSEADLCLEDPGGEPDLDVGATVRALTAVWMGRITLDHALRDESVRLFGTAPVRRAFRHWFGVSTFAALSRAG